ncbi:MAG TPA: hypothetical protein VFZ65_05815, partial [Planctomycetota bacterium]|nr:hypothetical protein [Planctomycetota bacterium]
LGRFAPNGAPCAVFDQTIAAWAMVSAWGLSNYKLLEANAARAVAAVEQAMLAPDGPPTGAELGAVLALLGEQYASFGRAEPARRITALARQALAGQAFGKTRRGDAALHLAQMVLGETFLPELTVARTWPGDLTADPLQTLFAVQAVQRTDAKVRAQQVEILRGLLVPGACEQGALAWRAAAEFDDATSNALLLIALGTGNKPFASAGSK